MRRRMLASVGGKPLPYLRRVAYLEMTDSINLGYINTGIVPLGTDDFECGVFKTVGGYGATVFGQGWNPKLYTFLIESKTSVVFMMNSSYAYLTVPEIDYDRINIVRKSGKNVWWNETSRTVNETVTSSATLRLWNSSYTKPSAICYFNLVRNGEYLLKLIPVVADFGSGEEGCMYNEAYKPDGKHGEMIYRNVGKGSFSWGELDAASALVSSRGGGYKCLTPRRSYRRSSLPSARFCAHSHRWEVAA